MAIKTKKRVNISIAPEINAALHRLAERDQMPVASKALELIKKALQVEEDDALDFLAQERDVRGTRYLSHQKTWERPTK